ncbi:hypothetical protein Ait01nite_089330 [Actinoplanes italicus]|uniref:Uncharacterized protein n=1 Tax=Actinoplanes italicus TaxID=113567 RepID=A0A2T0JIN8_9ACTN|nr:hypothetical protein [Actinoplanes italicus]PRX07349.1 hypothetical protein CLV67_14224 [Actinoplanes italicus]GIE35888.1 hypothetical protein Ait01nite_089330 [Actinoplanes italicus]
MSTRRASRPRRPAVFTLTKDIGSWLLGVGLIVHQAGFVPATDFNITLTLLGAVLVGVPGASQLLALRTGGQPSEDPPSESSSPSRRSPSEQQEADR